jgi:hypothetical protein
MRHKPGEHSACICDAKYSIGRYVRKKKLSQAFNASQHDGKSGSFAKSQVKPL